MSMWPFRLPKANRHIALGAKGLNIFSIYYLAMRKNEIMPFSAMWRELEVIMLSETSQSEEDRYHMFSLIRGS